MGYDTPSREVFSSPESVIGVTLPHSTCGGVAIHTFARESGKLFNRAFSLRVFFFEGVCAHARARVCVWHTRVRVSWSFSVFA